MYEPAEEQKLLKTESSALNQFFRGGLRWGSICEVGLHSGQWGRSLILDFLRCHEAGSLWVYPEGDTAPYPPAWAAQGINLNLLHFMEYSGDLSHLRSLFLEPIFSLIILDQPGRLSKGLLSSWAALIRRNKQILFILRPYFLKVENGTPLATYRFNAAFCLAEKKMHLFPVKGVGPQNLTLSKALDL